MSMENIRDSSLNQVSTDGSGINHDCSVINRETAQPVSQGKWKKQENILS